MTADECDEALERYSPDDLTFALAYADKNQVDPEWRAALDRAKVREGGAVENHGTIGAGRRG